MLSPTFTLGVVVVTPVTFTDFSNSKSATPPALIGALSSSSSLWSPSSFAGVESVSSSLAAPT